MVEATPVEELNSVRYLYLRELSEPQDNSLKLIVEEAVVNRAAVASFHPELEAILKDASPIESVEGCRGFEIYWKRCAAYLVTEELVGSNSVTGYDDESYTGKILRVYSRSHFLDHLAPAIQDRAVIEAKQAVVQVIAQLLRSPLEGIAKLDRKIEEAAGAHPDFFIF